MKAREKTEIDLDGATLTPLLNDSGLLSNVTGAIIRNYEFATPGSMPKPIGALAQAVGEGFWPLPDHQHQHIQGAVPLARFQALVQSTI